MPTISGKTRQANGLRESCHGDLACLSNKEAAKGSKGFLGPRKSGLVEQAQVELDARGNVKASVADYQTSSDKIFACGDMRRGQSLVVWAINEGRGAARECDRYLMGETGLP